jgi:UDP:flavonoid glycosyltransferase YjiC (YdhE family)
MAKVLVCWELGANLGHVTRQALVAERLREAGHEVLFAVRELANAAAVLGRRGFRYVQAPIHAGQARFPRPPVNYSELLLAEGYGMPAALLSQVSAWQSLFDLFGADAVIVDHAPTALLAAHARDLPRVQVGCGFAIPPVSDPFPRIRLSKGVSDAQLRKSDEVVSRSVNACLARLPGARPIGHVSDIFRAAPACLVTFAEIDHYGAREDAQYAGALFGTTGGPRVAWKSKDYPHVFAYLQNGTAGLKNMLTALGKSRAEVICAIPGIPERVARELSRRRLRVLNHPVPLAPLLDEAQLVVCHGGSGTSAQAFLSGVPLLALPASIEQLLQVRCYQRMGVGIAVGARRSVENIASALDELLSTGSYAEKAAHFANKYRGFRPTRAADQAVGFVERELSARRAAVN